MAPRPLPAIVASRIDEKVAAHTGPLEALSL